MSELSPKENFIKRLKNGEDVWFPEGYKNDINVALAYLKVYPYEVNRFPDSIRKEQKVANTSLAGMLSDINLASTIEKNTSGLRGVLLGYFSNKQLRNFFLDEDQLSYWRVKVRNEALKDFEKYTETKTQKQPADLREYVDTIFDKVGENKELVNGCVRYYMYEELLRDKIGNMG